MHELLLDFILLDLLQIFIDLIINQGSSTVLCAQN